MFNLVHLKNRWKRKIASEHKHGSVERRKTMDFGQWKNRVDFVGPSLKMLQVYIPLIYTAV